MPTSLSPTDICNIALSKIGALPINSITDLTSPSAIACNTNLTLAYLSSSRDSKWNCLLTTAILVQIPQTPLPTSPVPSNPATWAPFTTYQANTFLTYGGYYYSVEYTYTSTISFTNDLTTGALVQTNLPTDSTFPPNGSQYPSGWSFEYAIPDDFQLLAALNDNVGWWGFSGGGGDGATADYQIMGSNLFCSSAQAVIQYVKNQPDTSQFDSQFADCLTYKLAAMIATQLRQDGGKLEGEMGQIYDRLLRKARTTNGNEQQSRRFNPISSSRFIQSRYYGRNG